MHRGIFILALAGAEVASAFTGSCAWPVRRSGHAALQMQTQASPGDKPNWESPKAKLNALSANKANWGIDGAIDGAIPDLTAAVATAVKAKVAKELVGPWGETFAPQPWVRPEKKWIDRSGPKLKFPANVLAFKGPGAYNGGGWAKSNPSAVSEMKGTAMWIAITLCFVLQFSTAGTYSMRSDGTVERNTPLSIAKSKTTGESVSCVQTYRSVCMPSGFSDDAPIGTRSNNRPVEQTIVVKGSKK